MKHYHFSIVDNQVDDDGDEVLGVGADFYQLKRHHGDEEIHVKNIHGKITEIICEALTEESARKAVEGYLSWLKKT